MISIKFARHLSTRMLLIAIPNRYFGVFKNGDIKTRGIETRQHDTPAFIKDTQMQILEILAKAPNVKGLKGRLPEVQRLVEDKERKLKSRRIPPEQLIRSWSRLGTIRERTRSPAPSS